MNATLSLHDSRMAAEDLQNLTAELLRSIRQETELTAKLPEERGGAGAKGDAVTIGQILLTALGSGGAVAALLTVLKSYVERKPTLRFEIEAADGRKLKLEAEHLSPEQIAQTMQAVKQLCED
ncbi:MAG: effector-associated constant component EACC1 [Candidatus Electronema sp. V4]|uniref:effector-associated constant component EACC1 n=1 Tax=Candidatus Electronema sp. V4 TaxID=3454756 RepID=UPI00405569BA